MTPDELYDKYEKSLNLIRRGRSTAAMGEKIPERKAYYQGKSMALMARGEAGIKDVQTKLGRLRKRLKYKKKTTRVVTLTAINGVPWEIITKR